MKCRMTLTLLGLMALGAGACQNDSASSAAVGSAQRARELYDRGQFRESHELMRQLLSQDGPSVTLLYNYGCALFRDGKLGESVAAWESAKLLAPRDPDLRHNLQIAAGRQVDRLPEVERSAVTHFLDETVGSMSLDEWTLVIFALYSLLLVAIGLRVLLGSAALRDSMSTVLFLLGVLLLLGVSAWTRSWMAYHQPRAVVIAPEVTLTAGPDGSGKSIATVHAGLQLEVVGIAGQDRQVRLATGWLGYVPAASLEAIGLETWRHPDSGSTP
jgi:tetratricopeptide (TPR) repeat protein